MENWSSSPSKLKDKRRLDLLVVERGLAPSRQQAGAMILAGDVLVNGKVQVKGGTLVALDAEVTVAAPPRYVGRGGFKLEKALDTFELDVKEKICLDVGASTGGFTDCLLQHGASKVYAIDVGRGQMAWKLRQDPRVVCIEKLNARYLSEKEVPDRVDFCTIDVSFISIKNVLVPVRGRMHSQGKIVVLVKPQFEAGPQHVRKGIVRDKKIHVEVLEKILEWSREHQLWGSQLTYSPITGGDGNIEFLLLIDLQEALPPISTVKVVDEAHDVLKGVP